jgi:hypothetical protein
LVRRPVRDLSAVVAWLACLVAVVPAASAGVLFSQTETLSSGPPPVEQSFTPTAAQAGMVDVTVQDVGFPVSLTALRVAVTQGVTVLQTGVANNGAPEPLTLSFTANAGATYQIRVVGRPDTGLGAGAAVVTVTQHGVASNVYATFPAAFSIPLTPGAGGQLPDLTVKFPAAGNYTATLTDYALPAPIVNGSTGFLGAAIFQGATLVASITPGVPTPIAIPSQGNYTLRVIAASASGDGLFGLNIVDAANPATIVYPGAGSSGISALGTVTGPAIITNPAAGDVTLAVKDLAFPAALATLGAVLTDTEGQLIARQCVTSCGPADVLTGAAPAGQLLLWRDAQASPAAASGTGSYLISLASGAATLYTDVQAASSSTAGAATSAYSFPFTAPTSGMYTVTVNDLKAPAALSGIQFAVFQNGQQVNFGSLGMAGPVNVSLAAGPATVNVVAQSATSSQGSGIFGLQIATLGGTPTTVVALSQAVGEFTGSKTFSVTNATAGAYALTLKDAQWPIIFETLDVFITQGAQILGKVYGGGTIPLTLAAGDYQLTYSAVPDTTEKAGLYQFEVASTTPPTVQLTASQTAVTSGQSVSLSWTTTGATSCTASGAWSGAQPLTASMVAQAALTATATYTLTCEGVGGTTKAFVTVTVDSSSGSGGGGGGGAFDLPALAALAAFLALRRRRQSAVVLRR